MGTTYPQTLVDPRARSTTGDQFRRPSATKKRLLIVVNPYATTVSHRLKNLVVYALKSRYEVEAIDTESPNHATDITRKIGRDDCDLVVSFGGDGTANEIASGLVGTGIPMSFLPGGATNVICRTLGIPNDIVEATEHLLTVADDFRPWQIDLGRINDGYFLFACGVGLDALAFQRWDEHPKLKARLGEYYWLNSVANAMLRDYIRDPYCFQIEVDGMEPFSSVQLVLQNSDPATYFGDRQLHICEDVHLTSATLSMTSLKQMKLREVPYLGYRVLSGKPISNLKSIDHAEGFTTAKVTTGCSRHGELRPFPVQVDGDYIGDFAEINFGIAPRALTVVA